MDADLTIGCDVAAQSNQDVTPTNLIQVILRVMSLVGETRTEVERGLADVMIYPDLGERTAIDLGNTEEPIATALEATENVVAEIRAIIERRSSFAHKVRFGLVNKMRAVLSEAE